MRDHKSGSGKKERKRGSAEKEYKKRSTKNGSAKSGVSKSESEIKLERKIRSAKNGSVNNICMYNCTRTSKSRECKKAVK